MVALDFQTSGPAPNIVGSTGAGGGALGSILQPDKIQQDQYLFIRPKLNLLILLLLHQTSNRYMVH